MRKILILVEHFPNRIQPWLLNWIIESIKRDDSVDIIASGVLGDTWQPKIYQFNLLNAVEYYPCNSMRDVLPLLVPYLIPYTNNGKRAYSGLLKILKNGFLEIENFKDLIRALARAPALSRNKYDLIHSHMVGMSYEYLFLKKTLNIPLVTTFHGLPPAGVPQLATEKLMSVFGACDLFLVNTNFAKQQLASLGCPHNKISILPQGISCDDFRFISKSLPYSDKIILLSVGRLHDDKGYAYAINAVSKLIKSGHDIEYRIIGEGPHRNQFENMVVDMGMQQHIRILDSMVGSKLASQYHDAHIFILPSLGKNVGNWEETQGVVIQEAQASGVIVVATKTGGIPECVIDEENAFLVSDRSSDEIAEKIRYIIETPEKWHEWQFKARKHVEDNFAIEVLATKLSGIYDEVIEKHKQI